ncbi:MAG: hypothetical protein JSR33_03495 [Proteobacteria bacterium]|nr:hypothetical protein [Pseudomonadota bacterium]
MKNTRFKKYHPFLGAILNRRWQIIITIFIYAIISGVARYTFHVESYSDSTFLGMACGFGVLAAMWLIYNIRMK